MIMILRLRVGGTVTVDRDTANSRCVNTGVLRVLPLREVEVGCNTNLGGKLVL